MNLGFRLAPEHRAVLDAIQAEHRADPPSNRATSKPLRYERHVAPIGGIMTAHAALAANPMASADAACDVGRDRLEDFLRAVAAKFSPDNEVSASAAAKVAGVAVTTAQNRIGRAKRQGRWPYRPGKSGVDPRKAKGGKR